MFMILQDFHQVFAGVWDNKTQAFSNPSLFARVRVRIEPEAIYQDRIWYRQSQAYNYNLQNPYRVRLLEVVTTDESRFLVIRHYKPEEEINYLEGCNMNVVQVEESKSEFYGAIASNSCKVQKKGKETCLRSELYVNTNEMRTLDQGFDTETGKLVWGSRHGHFIFHRIKNAS